MNSKQYPRSYESVRAAVVAFMRACDPHMEKLRERQMLKEAIKLMDGEKLSIGSGLKNTGMKRSVDDLGRVVIPKELRTNLDWEHETPIEFFLDDAAKVVVLQKYRMEKCAICGWEDNLTTIKKKHICEDCISKVFEGEG